MLTYFRLILAENRKTEMWRITGEMDFLDIMLEVF